MKDNNVIQFSMAGVPVYLIVGAHNIQALFKPSRKIGSEALMQQLIFPKILGMPKDEVSRFEMDVTGRSKVPNPGTEGISLEQRLWHTNHQIYSRYLARTESTNRLSEIYYGRMLKEFDSQPIGEWVTLSLVKFCR